MLKKRASEREHLSFEESQPSGDRVGLRPPLKWAGGKRWQLPELRERWMSHQHCRLVEPFCGGLAVALGLMPLRALLNDVNPHLISFYQWLKRGLSIEIPRENTPSCYYRNRVRFNELVATGQADSAETAALFYYLNRTGYNGLCRFNRQGQFNVPFGRYANIGYMNGEDFFQYRSVFEPFEFTSLDFEAIPLEIGDFVYADPPYDVEFRQYSKDGFGWEDQQRTAEWLSRHPGPVVLSNQATARIKKLYKKLGYNLTPLTAPRLISCTGDRTPAQEVLATRNL
ncbi:MAG: Dam family site-specific DNA-(adenine-N6)-methyltransferase [Acidobacteria bacterium]|nr:Dam family site-specific DNA-(adenine-N6)-methyltransferase [Acidobacteriota bacterium]